MTHHTDAGVDTALALLLVGSLIWNLWQLWRATHWRQQAELWEERARQRRKIEPRNPGTNSTQVIR